MKDFRAIREEVLFGLGWEQETFDELIASLQCRFSHDDPDFMDCFWASCDHTDHFGCRCVDCSEENAPVYYHESGTYDYAQEETTALGQEDQWERKSSMRDVETKEDLSYEDCIFILDAEIIRLSERLAPIE